MRTGVRILAVATAGLAALLGSSSALAAAPFGSASIPVPVGPGLADAAVRQVIRTAAGMVYVFAIDDGGSAGTGCALRVYRATATGIPTAFEEVAAGAGASVAAPLCLSGVDARLGSDGIVRLAYLRGTGTGASTVEYQTYDPAAESFGATEQVVASLASAVRGGTSAALALDHLGNVSVVVADPQGVRAYRREVDAAWTLDTTTALSSAAATHPSVVVDRLDRLHVAWLEGSAVRYALRAAGLWGSATTVSTAARPAGSVDQGPSIAVDAADQPVVAYATAGGALAVRRGDLSGWSDLSPATAIGGRPASLYLRNGDVIAIAGRGAGVNPVVLGRSAADATWSAPAALHPATPGFGWSGGSSIRYDAVDDPDCTVVDAIVGDDDSDARGGGRPDLYYVALALSTPSGDGSCTERSSGVQTVPAATFTARPNLTAIGDTTTLAWQTTGAVVAQTCSVDGSAFTACASPLVVANALGPHNLRVGVTNDAGSAVATATWTGVLPKPTITLVARPSEVSESRSATFVFDRTGIGTTWCRLDSDIFRGCTSPVVYPTVSNGPHVFTLRIQNVSGSTTIGPIAWSVAKATAPPTIGITDGPLGLVGERDAVIAWATSGVIAATECRLDGGAFTACYTPHLVTALTRGPHTLDVRVTNSLGSASDTRSWTVGDPPPAVSVTSRPPASSTSPSATIAWTSTGAVAATSCVLDGGLPQPCVSPRVLDGLGFGAHSFTITVSGGAGAGSVQVDWTVTPAAIAFNDRPADVTASTSATFGWTVNGPIGTVTCRLDQGAFVACSSPTTLTVAAGVHTFIVRSATAQGNAENGVTWTVDTGQVASGGIDVAIQGRPAPHTTATTATVAWTTTGGATDLFCSLDGAPRSVCSSPLQLADLAIGEHSLEIRASTQDATGARVLGWIVEEPTPHVTLDAFPSDPSPARSASVAWSSSGTIAAVTCSVDDGRFAACTSPLALSGLAKGRHVVVVRATGPSGEDRATFTWVVADPMTVSVAARPPDRSRLTAATVVWDTSSAAAQTMCVVDGSEAVSCASPFTVQDLAGGTHAITITATGGAGQGAASVQFTTVPDGPLVFLTRKPATGLGTTARIGWRIDGAITGQQCRIDGGPWKVCASPRLLRGVLPGRHTFQIHVWSGKLSSDVTARWTVWGVPSLRLTQRPPSSTAHTVAQFRWKVTGTARKVRCSLDGHAWHTCGRRVRYTGLGRGHHVLEIRAIGPAGNGRLRYAWLVT